MENELNSILSKILKYYLSSNQNKDFKWFELFLKINNFTYQLPNIKSDYEKDCELATIMTFMEYQYNIPILKINIIDWLKSANYNTFVFNIYTCLSDLRSL